MKGLIVNKGEEYFTDMQSVLACFENNADQYNWLISDCQVYFENKDVERLLDEEYCWLSGEKLMQIVSLEENQWIWGVLSAFPKYVDKNIALSYPLPYALENENIWKNPVAAQNPLAEIEIIAWDGCCTVVKCKDEKLLEEVRKKYSLSEDLELYNKSVWK